jgi:hypothetical protein
VNAQSELPAKYVLCMESGQVHTIGRIIPKRSRNLMPIPLAEAMDGAGGFTESKWQFHVIGAQALPVRATAKTI